MYGSQDAGDDDEESKEPDHEREQISDEEH